LPSDFTTSTLGICRDRCDHDAGTACPDPSETCFPGEVVPTGVDTCYDLKTPYLEIGRACPFNTPSREPCAPMALCVGSISQRCENVCRTSVGPIGMIGHADCVDPRKTCRQISPGLAYGVCDN
jgi:hypothetical protein